MNANKDYLMHILNITGIIIPELVNYKPNIAFLN